MTPDRMLDVLTQYPFPGAFDVRAVALGCYMVIAGQRLVYGDGGWLTGDCRKIPATWPAFDSPDDGDRVHAEIRRVLAVVTGAGEPSPPRQATPGEDKSPWEQIKGTYWVGPDLPDADPCVPALAELAAEPPPEDALYDRLTDEIDRRRDVEAQLAKMTDAHAVVSQRLVGSQKEVAEVTAERDRLTKQTAAMRVSFAEFERRGQQIESDDALRSAIAVAVGLDGSASLALILDTVTRDRPDDPRAVNGLRALVAYHQAPVKFGDRPLTLAERASFVIRRLWQGRANAANEAASLRRELSDIADALGDLPDTAEREPIGDREEHLGLSTAERLRLHFGARS